MRNSLWVLTILIAVLLFTITALGIPKTENVTISDQGGTLLVKSIAPSGTWDPENMPETRIFGTDQEILWTTDDGAAIANDVAMSGDGSYGLSGWYLNYERTSKYQTLGSGVPLWEYSMVPNWYIPVASSDDGNVIASLGDNIPMKTWLNGAGPNPSWQYSWPIGYLGSDLDVSDDGSYIVAVCKENGGDFARLLVFNSGGSTVLWQIDFDATTGVNGIEISEDNEWILITTYWNFYVFRMSTQSLFFTGDNYSQTMGGMDDDAEWIATGDFNGQLHVYQRIGATYTEQWNHYFGGWVTAVDISNDGSTVLGGNFTYSPSNAGKAIGFTIDGTQIFTYDQYGDYVDDVALSNDGSIGIAGSWGAYGVTYGDVFTAFDMDNGDVIFQLLDDIEEPGSIFEVGISDDGSYAFCGGKAVHAREFGNGGQVYSILLSEPGPFNVTITLTPENPPITIPAGGGSFEFNLAIQNNESTPVTFDAWTMATLPNGNQYGPLILTEINAPASWGTDRDRTQYVPANAPSGNYIYHAYIGQYPNIIWDEDQFNFTKSAVSDGEVYNYGWHCEGESFNNVITTPENNAIVPEHYNLVYNYPNPFNNQTTIEFNLEEKGQVKLTVYNTLGETIETLLNGFSQAGQQSVAFDASELTSGIYFYKLETDNFSEVRKMILLK